jgi:cell division inhibitor SepF
VGWFDRFLSWMGFEVADEADEMAAAPEPSPPRSRRGERWARREEPSFARLERVEPRADPRGQLVSLPGSAVQRVIIVTPRSFYDVQLVADHLKNRRPVVVNLEGVEKELAQRMLNFLSGTIYALNGEMHRVSSHTLFLAPGGVEVVLEGRGRSGSGLEE